MSTTDEHLPAAQAPVLEQKLKLGLTQQPPEQPCVSKSGRCPYNARLLHMQEFSSLVLNLPIPAIQPEQASFCGIAECLLTLGQNGRDWQHLAFQIGQECSQEGAHTEQLPGKSVGSTPDPALNSAATEESPSGSNDRKIPKARPKDSDVAM